MIGDDIPDAKLPAMRPGQISEPERKMLYWAGSKRWQGLGEIVEVGAFLGKSTSCLAAGMAANSHKDRHKRLHVFDRWEINDSNTFYRLWMDGVGPEFRGSFKNEFDRNTAEWASYIKTYQGDARVVPWSGRPIEILFLDCSTSHEFHQMLFEKFYHSLVARAGLLIHQDYFFHRSYYLPPMMLKLGQWLPMIGNADTSAMFNCASPLPDWVFERPLFESDEEMLALLKEVMVAVGGPTSIGGGMLCTMLVFYHRTHGREDLADSMAATLRHDHSGEHNPVLTNLETAMRGEVHI